MKGAANFEQSVLTNVVEARAKATAITVDASIIDDPAKLKAFEEARTNALQNVNDLYVLDLLKDKTKMAFKKIVSLSYPDYSTEITIADLPAAGKSPELPADTNSKNQASNNEKT